jgi:hypothetical protein
MRGGRLAAFKHPAPVRALDTSLLILAYAFVTPIRGALASVRALESVAGLMVAALVMPAPGFSPPLVSYTKTPPHS